MTDLTKARLSGGRYIFQKLDSDHSQLLAFFGKLNDGVNEGNKWTMFPNYRNGSESVGPEQLIDDVRWGDVVETSANDRRVAFILANLGEMG